MYKSKQNYAITPPASAIRDQSVDLKNDSSASAASRKLDPSQPEMSPSPSSSPSANSASVAPSLSLEQQVSGQSKTQFLQEAFLQMDMPENIPFQKVDLSFPDMSAIYSRANGMEMAVVAKKGEADQKDVEAFLKSADTGIPNLDKRGIQFAPPKNKTPASGSGMKSAQLYSGVGPNNQEIHVAVFSRADGLGTYMFVVSGDASTLEARADDFEKIYNSMKAQTGAQ
ncbi:hypothetical protein AZI86_04705 [Bdellovibrio bacteriovorus]|uniref:Uncharacterized protein n=1 Tax=Bdellovibrio bacteriovorus TaxID=959 RepID=A0A150WPX9_BDEBC|nr:hypothetical protein [Bdellovibrio bacteriovorus]KYG66359.1 hypothetical protein AZI86_04705 [Bdellovibrio bacteriovorus]